MYSGQCTLYNVHHCTSVHLRSPGLYLFLQVQLPLSLATVRHIHFLLIGWGQYIAVGIVYCSALGSVLCAVYIVKCVVCIMWCAVLIFQCAVCSLQSVYFISVINDVTNGVSLRPLTGL